MADFFSADVSHSALQNNKVYSVLLPPQVITSYSWNLRRKELICSFSQTTSCYIKHSLQIFSLSPFLSHTVILYFTFIHVFFFSNTNSLCPTYITVLSTHTHTHTHTHTPSFTHYYSFPLSQTLSLFVFLYYSVWHMQSHSHTHNNPLL